MSRLTRGFQSTLGSISSCSYLLHGRNAAASWLLRGYWIAVTARSTIPRWLHKGNDWL
ncbi:hypothetical protein BDV37DRAFT_265439 [Aspergillus pseudonomiae]|uniref:Uncharacterized protein n=1 Tax=Aspergillus pseudonomiae TaxID=1506151 RepID=A0A5N7CTP4_9EURO|nr:uncharacterized protein BDV37DRAFT_265439 [Aspergillus pseudonomiae]KAE8397576.1 hypothetical protein BDV37DRAFT_265439 [Aspergillus pseudonomiae]